jgi:hypothetical protein
VGLPLPDTPGMVGRLTDVGRGIQIPMGLVLPVEGNDKGCHWHGVLVVRDHVVDRQFTVTIQMCAGDAAIVAGTHLWLTMPADQGTELLLVANVLDVPN